MLSVLRSCVHLAKASNPASQRMKIVHTTMDNFGFRVEVIQGKEYSLQRQHQEWQRECLMIHSHHIEQRHMHRRLYQALVCTRRALDFESVIPPSDQGLARMVCFNLGEMLIDSVFTASCIWEPSQCCGHLESHEFLTAVMVG